MSESRRFIRVEDLDGVRIVFFPHLCFVAHQDLWDMGGELLALVEQENPCPVVLDFENQTFIPYASIELEFVRLYRRLPNGLVMCNLCPSVREHFAGNGLDRIFRIYDSREEAISAALNE